MDPRDTASQQPLVFIHKPPTPTRHDPPCPPQPPTLLTAR